ncbi:unnamed protein product [Meloidogyne enterolobii]|uniref:Uncharacterized protein n=1 Tax=Meloidogyne enterolobii TaxID=390850 RepID=A0ACB0Z1E1_MELEN
MGDVWISGQSHKTNFGLVFLFNFYFFFDLSESKLFALSIPLLRTFFDTNGFFSIPPLGFV